MYTRHVHSSVLPRSERESFPFMSIPPPATISLSLSISLSLWDLTWYWEGVYKILFCISAFALKHSHELLTITGLMRQKKWTMWDEKVKKWMCSLSLSSNLDGNTYWLVGTITSEIGLMRTLTDLICVNCMIGDYVSSYLVFLFNVRLTQSSALFPRMV